MNELTTTAPRLPMPEGFPDSPLWRVLTEAIYPRAKSTGSILLALNYCKARGLDILKRPVNIVPIWDSQLGREVETVWPSINEIEVTAARTQQWAGMDDPRWGPAKTETFKGQRKDRKKGWVPHEVTVTYPESCAVTVYRMVGGQKCAFSEPIFWKEAYARVGGANATLPNDMWTKRPYGQLHKVAKAASLRTAFPEETDYSAEEMEGQTVETSPPAGPAEPADNWQPPNDGRGAAENALDSSTPDKPPMTEKHGGGTAPDEKTFGPEAQKVANAGGPPEEEIPPDEYDPETGEIGPRKVDRNKDESWREWCIRLLEHIRKEKELEPIDEWVSKNKVDIATVLKEAPKLHANLAAAIGKHRAGILQQQDTEERNGAPM